MLPADPQPTADEGSTVNAPLRRSRWLARKALAAGLSSIDRVRRCGRFLIGEHVTLAMRGDRAHYSGLETCGSVWACPICSARVWAERRSEVERAIESHHAAGGRVALVTLTMRHKRGDPLPALWNSLGDAWKAARGDYSGARRAMREAGVTGWLRVVEATHGANSWHLHVHSLIFVHGSITDEGAQLLGHGMFGAWAKRLDRDGFMPVRDSGGLDVRLVALDGGGDALGEYLSKATFGEASSAAAEVAGQHGKSGRRSNRTPWQILADLIDTGEARDFALWREYEAASKGRRALTWSQGLRDRLLDDEELTDEAIAAANDGEQVDLALLPADSWRVIYGRPGMPAAILEVIEGVPPAGRRLALDVMLDGLGLPPSLPPPPRTDTT